MCLYKAFTDTNIINMDKKKKRPYEAPQLTTVTFKAERGYATSLRSLSFAALALGLSASDNGVMEAKRDNYGLNDFGTW